MSKKLLIQKNFVAIVSDQFKGELSLDSIDDDGVYAVGGSHPDVIAEFETLIEFEESPELFDDV